MMLQEALRHSESRQRGPKIGLCNYALRALSAMLKIETADVFRVLSNPIQSTYSTALKVRGFSAHTAIPQL